MVRVSRKGSPSVPGSSMVKFDLWIYGTEVLLKFVDLIFPSGLSTSQYHNYHLINIGDTGMAKDSKWSR